MSVARGPRRASDWGTIILGVIVALLGLPMAIGGVELISLGGSWYYAICGVVVVVAGVLILLGRSLGAVLYLLAWIGTWIWSLWEVGFDGWGLLPRVFGPTILALFVLLALPALRRQERLRTVTLSARGAV